MAADHRREELAEDRARFERYMEQQHGGLWRKYHQHIACLELLAGLVAVEAGVRDEHRLPPSHAPPVKPGDGTQ
jgi:hypothetical protein